MKRLFLLSLCALVSIPFFNLICYADGDNGKFTDLKGPYLGQTPPGDTPRIFAPGVISGKSLEHGPAVFSRDGKEVYWCSRIGRKADLWVMRRVNNRWTRPENLLPYGKEVKWMDPFVSVDNKRLYFSADRSEIFKKDGPIKYNRDIWFVERKGKGWSKPQDPGNEVNGENGQCQATFTSKGTAYYIDYRTVNKKWSCDIVKAEYKNGRYLKPEKLPAVINSDYEDWTPCIAPDESYMVFARKIEKRNCDLYISFRDKGRWSEAVNLGDKINTPVQETYPMISPDGKYLFFTRYTDNKTGMDVYWVSTKIIEKIKKKMRK